MTKLFLALLTVAYDLIFVVQHYVLYRKNDSVEQDKEKLVENNGVGDLVSVEESEGNVG